MTGPSRNFSPALSRAGGTRCNLISFSPYGNSGQPDNENPPQERAFLTISAPWSFSVGLEPNINSGVLPWTEYENIVNLLNRPGRIEFWYNNTPPRPDDPSNDQPHPDFAIDYQTIVEIHPNGIGQAGLDIFPRVVEYELFFADFRSDYVSPRGGRLSIGYLNPGPQPPDDSGSTAPDDETPQEMLLSDLINLCLAKMDLADVELPEDVDELPAPRELKWFGNHAPAELKKLLEYGGLLFVPHIDGTVTIERPTSEGEPAIQDTDDRLADVELPAVDRRGKYIVFTSFPTQIQITEESGLDQSQPDDPSSGNWDFVILDKTNRWTPIDEAQLLKPDVRTHIQQNFQQIDEKYRERVVAQLFRYIRLKPEVWDPTISPLRRKTIEADLSEADVTITAQVAIRDFDYGLWTNSKNALSIPAEFCPGENIIQAAVPLVTVTGPCRDLFFGFKQGAAFTVRYTVGSSQTAVVEQGGKPALLEVPEYYDIGFKRDGSGNITPMTDDEVQNVLDGGISDALIVPRPEMMLVNVDGEDVNDQNLSDAARVLAERYLRDETPARQARVRGFAQIELSGLISKVQWDQENLITTADMNDWYTAEGMWLYGHMDLRTTELNSGGQQDAYPGQSNFELQRISNGDAGAQQPNVPLNPMPQRPAAVPTRVAIVTGNATCGGVYTGYIPKPDSKPVDPKASTFAFSGAGQNVVIVNVQEMGKSTHIVPANMPFIFADALPQPPTAQGAQPDPNDGLPTVYISYDPEAIRAVRWNAGTKTLQQSNYRSPPKDSDWTNIVLFVPCS